MAETSTKLGRVSLVPRGAYDAAAVYNRLDIVEYAGSSYLVLTDGTTGVTPVNGEAYMLIAQAGAEPLRITFASSSSKPVKGQTISAEFTQFNRKPKERESVVGVMTGMQSSSSQFICYISGIVTAANDFLETAQVKLDTVYDFYGPKGDPGNPGTPGAKGDPGEDGVGIQSIARTGGDGSPGTADTYTITLTNGNTSTFTVYNGADGTSFTVLGRYDTLEAMKAAHPTGSEGEAWAVGSADDNDVYLWDVDTAAWTNIGSLQGPPGAPGQDGPPGAPGANGADGKSAYQIAVDNGYTGTETEWLASLKGADGAPGSAGTNGTNGEDGKTAYQYAQDGGYTGTEAEFQALMGSGPWLPTKGGTITGHVHLTGSSRIQYDSNGPFIYPMSSGYMPTLMADGSIAYFGNRNQKGSRLQGVADPVNAADAANKDYVDSKAGGVPSGAIVMWSGAANAIPTGWALCDGANNTPDLRNRFIVGAGSTYAVGATGGSDTVTLTVKQMPSHTHQLNTSRYAGSFGSIAGPSEYGQSADTTLATGGGQAHENRPPYYALCFIMKT